MKRKTIKNNPSGPIIFSPAEKGVLKRMRTCAERHLHIQTIIDAKDTSDLVYPSEAEIDYEFAKRLVVWLSKKNAKTNK